MGRPRHFDKPEKWDNFSHVTDYAALAYGFAKSYCKAHPEADKNIVFGTASDAAFLYEMSTTLKKYKFKNFVNVKIRNAIYQNKKEDEKMVTPEEKAAMIADRKTGMSYGQIAIKYNRDKSSVTTNLLNWKKQGAFETPEDEDKKKIKYEKPEILPGPPEIVDKIQVAGVEPVMEEDGTKVWTMKNVDLPAETIEDDPSGNLWNDIANELSVFAEGILGAGTKTISRSSSEETSFATVKLRTPDGKKIKLKMEVV